MQLYHIANEYQRAFDAIGEIGETDFPEVVSMEQFIADSMAAINTQFEEKAAAIAAYILNLEAEAEEVKIAVKRMQMRHVKLSVKAESLKEYLLLNMKSCEKHIISTPEFSVKIMKNPPKLIVNDQKALEKYPELWHIIPEEKRLNNALLKDALKDKKKYEGAHLEQSDRLQFS